MAGKPHPDDPKRCSATSRRTGTRCGAWAVTGRNVCHHHGGKSPRGIGSPHYEHGRYSKSVPACLSQSYEEALNDPKRLELDPELAVVISRNRELLSSLYSGESDGLWLRLRKEKRALNEARRRAEVARSRGDTEAEDRYAAAQAEHLNEIMRMISRGAPDGERWEEFMRGVACQRRLAESERRRRIEDHQMATTEELAAMLGAVAGIVARHVSDPQIRRALARDLDSLADFGPADGPDGELS